MGGFSVLFLKIASLLVVNCTVSISKSRRLNALYA